MMAKAGNYQVHDYNGSWTPKIFTLSSGLASCLSTLIRSDFLSPDCIVNKTQSMGASSIIWAESLKINRASDHHLLKAVSKYYSGTLLFECLFMKIRLLLWSLFNTTAMSPKKWTEIDSSLPITEKKHNCILKIQTKVSAQTNNSPTAYCPTFS